MSLWGETGPLASTSRHYAAIPRDQRWVQAPKSPLQIDWVARFNVFVSSHGVLTKRLRSLWSSIENLELLCRLPVVSRSQDFVG
jgi:hypothetical protein